MRKNKPETQERPELASKAGEFMIGNDLRVTRLGFGATRITEIEFGASPQIGLGPPGFCVVPSNRGSIGFIVYTLHQFGW
jgi:hypothetical protein